MKCVILAAGYATRLYPLTENFPKPLLKVQDKTILDWLIEDIDSSGLVDEYIVISNHKFAHHFDAWATAEAVKHTVQKITVVDDGTSSNETRLGAVRDIQFALEKLGYVRVGKANSQEEAAVGASSAVSEASAAVDDMLVIAGDNLLDFSLAEFVRYADAKKASCIMRYYEAEYEKLIKCGVVTIDETDKILSMTEKSKEPASHWCCPPFYFYTARDIARIPEAIADGCGVDAPGSLAAWLSAKADVYAFEMPGRRYDIGNLASYEQVQLEYKGVTK